jgi:sphingomyelin phosphodiesterase acid-like 3
MPRSRANILATLVLAIVAHSALAAAPPSPPTIPGLFLSDIHFDPFSDPAKVAKLNTAPAAKWFAILAAPASATQPQDSAALQRTCPVRGTDTNNILWQSSLSAIHAHAWSPRFVTISGDLLAHAFDCKYKALLPTATHADYLDFTEKTIHYIFANLRAAVSSVPIYIALGNNDSGCTDYALDAYHDEFLARMAPLIAEGLPDSLSEADHNSALHDFAAGGYYSVPLDYGIPLAAIPKTRLLVLDDLFLSSKYATCAGKPDAAPAAAQLAWLEAQLASARERKEHVWVMGHIPPGVDLYATARKLTNICGGVKPQMFLGSESLAEVLARNSDVIRLALFGHTHSDEMRLLEREPADPEKAASSSHASGVPLKIVASITPVNGNRPTFTLASINPATATLVDYTVIEASNLTGVDATWAPEYTYSTAYGEPAFDSASVATLITGFQSDPAAKSSASQAYLRNYFPGDISAVIQFAWPQYACSMDHDSGASFSACACAAMK